MSDPELLEEAWDHVLYSVDVPKNKSVYRVGPRAELPELINTQVIASRDPRLSPTIPPTSVYSRDYPFEDNWSDEGDDDSDSFHSEDWYCQDVGESFEEEAKNLKVRIHINPKFFPNLNSTTDNELDKKPLENDGDGENMPIRLGEGRTRSRRLDEIRKPYQGQMPGWMKEYLEESRAAKLEPDKTISAEVGRDKFSDTPTARKSGQSARTETERERNHSSPKGEVLQVTSRKEHPEREGTSDKSEKKSYQKADSLLPCSDMEGLPILPVVETSRSHDDGTKLKALSASASDNDQASKAKPYSDQAWLEATQEFLDEAKKTKTSGTSSKPPAPKEGYCTDAKKKRSRSKSGSRRYPVRDAVAHGDMTAREGTPVQVNTPQSTPEDSIPGIPPKKSQAPTKQLSRDREEEDIVLDPRVPDIYRAEMEEKIQEERRRKREAKLEEMKSPNLSIGDKLKQIAESNSCKQSDESEPSPKKMALNKPERRPEKAARADDGHKKDTDKKSRMGSTQDIKSAHTTHIVAIKSEEISNRSRTNEQDRIPHEGNHHTPTEQPRKSKQKQHSDSEKHKHVSTHEKQKFSDAAWKPVPISESADVSKATPSSVSKTNVPATTRDSSRILDPAEPSPVREHSKSTDSNQSKESRSKKRSKRKESEDPKHIQLESTEIPPEVKQEHHQVTHKLCRKENKMTDIPLDSKLEHHSSTRSTDNNRPAADMPKKKDRSRRRQIVSPPRSPQDEEQDKPKYDQDMQPEYARNEQPENVQLKGQHKVQTQEADSPRHNLLTRIDKSGMRHGRAEYPHSHSQSHKTGTESQRTEAIQADYTDVPLPVRSDSRRKTQSDHFRESRNAREDLPPCKMFKPLSKYMTKVLNDQCQQENGRRVDTLVTGEQQQLVADLENICQGNKPRVQSGMPYKHFPPLSLNTELESTFMESPTVKRIYLQELKEWMTKRPLESYLVGRLCLEDKMPAEIPGSLKIDQTVKECSNSFHEEMYKILKSNDGVPDPQNVFPVPKSNTEETTDQVFRQVTKYMDFLASKSFLVEQEQQQTKGSQQLERTQIKLVNDRLPQGTACRSRTALDDRTNDHSLNTGHLDKRLSVTAAKPTVLQPVQTVQESRRQGNTCDITNRRDDTGVKTYDKNGSNRVAPVERRGEASSNVVSRDWNSRSGFVDRMEAIMIDRENPREIHPMKTIPLEPDDESGVVGLTVAQVKNTQTKQVKSSSQKAQPKASHLKIYVGGAESSKKSTVSHEHGRTPEDTVTKSLREASKPSDVPPVSSSMMYSPTQPTGPEEIMEHLEMQGNQDRQQRSSEGDGPKKRRGKDAENWVSKKKKKDKVKDTEESKKDEKRKKDKKDKKKEKKGRSKGEHKDDIRPSHDTIHKSGAGHHGHDNDVKVQEDEKQSQSGKEVKSSEAMKKNVQIEKAKPEREHTYEEHKSEKEKAGKAKSQNIDSKHGKGKDDSFPRQRGNASQPEDGEIMDDSQGSASIPQQDPESLSQMFLEYFSKFNEDLMKKCKDQTLDTKTFLSRIQEPENSFLWALLLAYYERQKEEIMAGLPEDFVEGTGTETKVQHTEVSKKPNHESSSSTDRKAHGTSSGEYGSKSNEYGTPMEGFAVEITEYGSTQVKLLQTQEDRESGELTPDEIKPEEVDTGKEKKKGSSRLLQAFRQQVEAKKRAQVTGEDKQRHLEKLSADKAAKKPAPKAAKPLFLPPSFAKPGDGTEIGEQMLAARKLGINLATTRETDIIIRQAFDMFAEKGANLVRQKLSNKLLDELAKGAQALLSNSATQLKHLDSLCGIALSIYKQLQEANLTTAAQKQEGSKEKPSSPTKHHKEKASKKDDDKADTSKKRRTTSDSWKDSSKHDGYMDESHATHMEDRSKITKDIMDGHEKLDFEKDKSQKDLSRLRKIGRPSYLFSARIERLVAEQKGKEPSTDEAMEVLDEPSVAERQSVDISDEEPIIIPSPESKSEPEKVQEMTEPIIVTESIAMDSGSGTTAPEPSVPATEHVDTEEDKSKKVSLSLPKGNKLMMAFRQAMLAKKRAQTKDGLRPSDTKNASKIVHQFGIKPKAPAGNSPNVATASMVPTKNEVSTPTVDPVFVCNTQTVCTTTSTVSVKSVGSMTVAAALPSQSFANTFSSPIPATSTTDSPHSSTSANMSFPLSLKDSLRFAKKPEEIHAVTRVKPTISAAPVTIESQSRWGPPVSSTAFLPPPAVVLAPALVSAPPPPLPETEQEPAPLPDVERTAGPALLPTPPRAMISAPPVMAIPPPLPKPDTIAAQVAVISAPPVMSRPPPCIPPPVSEPNASPALLPTPTVPSMISLPAAPLPQPSQGAAPGLLPTPPSTGMSSGLLPTPSSRPALLPTPGTPEAMLAAHYSSMASQGYMSHPSSVYQQPVYPQPPPFGSYPPPQPAAGPDYSQTSSVSDFTHPPPPVPQQSSDSGEKTGELSAIPLPPPGQPDADSNLDKSVYDPDVMAQYQQKVKDFLQRKQTTTPGPPPGYNNQSYNNNNSWNQYYQNQGHSGPPTSQQGSQDQWQQQWHNYWNSVSGQYHNPSWNSSQWGPDYSQQWDNWNQWNQATTPDVSQPPPGVSGPPGMPPTRGPLPSMPPPDSKVSDSEGKEWTERTKMPAMPLRPPVIASDLRIYVHNLEREACQRVQDFLLSIGAQRFDCNNLELLKLPQCPSLSYLVLVHSDDLQNLHMLPNLYKLRKELKIEFATFSKSEEVMAKKQELIMPHGGILLPDDISLMGLVPDCLEMLLEFMLGEKKLDRNWTLMIHKHLFTEIDRLRAEYSKNSMDHQRLADLTQLLVRYEDKGVVETLTDHKCTGTTRPSENYLPCCLQLQADGCRKYRQCYLISEISQSHPAIEIFQSHGIGIMSLSTFLETVAHKPSADIMPMPIPDYGHRESRLFWDAALSSSLKSINTDVSRECEPQPVIVDPALEPGPPGIESGSTTASSNVPVQQSGTTQYPQTDHDIQEVDMDVS